MASLTGFQLKQGVKKATTWGTAVTIGAGNGLSAKISKGLSPTTYRPLQIGTGAAFTPKLTLGAVRPQATLTGDVGYNNNFPLLLSAFMGTEAVGSEITVGQADYKHTLTLNTTRNGIYLSYGYQDSSSTSKEIPTAVVQSITLKTTSIPGIIEYTAVLFGNDIISGVTNTFAALANATVPDAEVTDCDYADIWQINLQSGGAVSSSDAQAITSWELQLTQPMEFVDEIKGSSGLNVPRLTGLADAKLTLGLKDNVDQTWFNAFKASTTYKAKLSLSGTQIGSGSNKTFSAFMPSLQLITDPKDDVQSEGQNPVQLSFEVVKAASAPTGMTASVYPYFEIINSLATSFIA
jgi:hypothetical protein